MRILYIPRIISPLTTIKYGLLYNWYSASSPATVEYGYFYNWYVIADSRNIANTDWSVPEYSDYTTLLNYLGAGGDYNTNTIAPSLMESGTTHWVTGGTNTTGFTAVGAGYRHVNGTFVLAKNSCYLRSKTLATSSLTYTMVLESGFANAGFVAAQFNWGYSQRLIYKGAGTPTSYTGNDGRLYSVVQIGSQYWTSQNLAETKYRNGDEIPEVTDNATWTSLTTGARSSYNNSITNVGLGSRIANTGWHVASKTEFRTLADYLGATGNYSVNVAGGKMKETGITYWDSPNTGATNECGFNGRGSGSRSSTGTFSGNKTICDMWTSTVVVGTTIELSFLSNDNTNLNVNSSAYISIGKSIRLVKDSTSLTNGQTGTYIGNDGKIYRTICIGTQEWLADNLAETKYKDTSDIVEITDNTQWANLTTGALCAYNNDWNNM